MSKKVFSSLLALCVLCLVAFSSMNSNVVSGMALERSSSTCDKSALPLQDVLIGTNVHKTLNSRTCHRTRSSLRNECKPRDRQTCL